MSYTVVVFFLLSIHLVCRRCNCFVDLDVAVTAGVEFVEISFACRRTVFFFCLFFFSLWLGVSSLSMYIMLTHSIVEGSKDLLLTVSRHCDGRSQFTFSSIFFFFCELIFLQFIYPHSTHIFAHSLLACYSQSSRSNMLRIFFGLLVIYLAITLKLIKFNILFPLKWAREREKKENVYQFSTTFKLLSN